MEPVRTATRTPLSPPKGSVSAAETNSGSSFGRQPTVKRTAAGSPPRQDSAADLERISVVIITSLPADNTLWICDLCNDQIPVTGDYTLIPLTGSYALCTPCATSFPYWPDGWTQPTPRACGCEACQTPLLETLSHV